VDLGPTVFKSETGRSATRCPVLGQLIDHLFLKATSAAGVQRKVSSQNAAHASRVCVTSLPYLSLRSTPPGRLAGLFMPSSILRHPTTEDDASDAQPKREFERWRVAVDIIRRLREAGIRCELRNVQNSH
jgi:hypothetical protein